VIGLLGGAFDPPHRGHLVLADEAVRHFALERLLVVPTGRAPHKPVETEPEIRFRLAEAAFDGRSGVELSRYEVDRDGPSYTVNTVAWAGRLFGEVVFIVGADEFASFLSWHDPEGVLRHARLGVATRPGYARDRLAEVLGAIERPDRVELFSIPSVPVSSSGIRERVRRGEPIDGLVTPRVAELIADLRLYRDPA
jgi:nicotinate-nucleotide adenylyltransferase